MKLFIQKLLRNALNIEIRRVNHTNRKEYPRIMNEFHIRRMIYFYDLHSQIKGINGDIVECGVGWGSSLFYFSICVGLFDKIRHIYGFDSFEEGFPELLKVDEPSGLKKGGMSITEDQVRRYLRNGKISQDFISDHITFVNGFFDETLAKYSELEIALLHLDVDLYQSYKECLEIAYPKVVKGGIIAFDEYQNPIKYPGAKKAIDEFLVESNETIIKSSIFDRYYLVKSN